MGFIRRMDINFEWSRNVVDIQTNVLRKENLKFMYNLTEGSSWVGVGIFT
jgi:hypothetical protein